MNVNFYLKEPKAKKSLIYLFYTINTKRVKISTGLFTDPKYWDNKKQRIKRTMAQSVEFNAILDKFVNDANRLFLESKVDNTVYDEDEFRSRVKSIINPNTQILQAEKSVIGLIDAFNSFIRDCSKTKGEQVIKSYRTTLNHIRKFSKERKYKLNFDSINKDFYDEYIDFSSNILNHVNNTIGKHIKNVKVFMKYALEKGLHQNLAFQKFKVLEEESISFALTLDELMRIEDLDFSKNSKMEISRNMFLLMSYTTMRISDLRNFKPVNIFWDEGYIKIKALKGKGEQTIALIPPLKRIFSNYPDCILPKIPSKINEDLKLIGKLAEINDQIQIVNYSGKKRIEKTYFKWEKISCHTARRTNITLNLIKGVPADIVRRQSGHKSMKHFEKYIKIANNDVVNAIGGAWE